MVSKADSNKARLHRHTRVRGKVSGTAERPRLCVYRSLNHIYAQVIDDVKGVTIAAAGSNEKDFGMTGGNKEAAWFSGINVRLHTADKGVSLVVFDRGGYIYHGRVKELAEGAREGGLKF